MASLEERIAAELHRVLDHQLRNGFSAPASDRGMVVGGPDEPEIVLTVEDVARIAAIVARTPEIQQPRMSADESRAQMAELGMVSTPESRAWAKETMAEAKRRSETMDWVGIRRRLAERVGEFSPREPEEPPA